MFIVFRVDASSAIGMGHLMRSLTLAETLKKLGHTCRFICRLEPTNLIDLIRARGFFVDTLGFQTACDSRLRSNQLSETAIIEADDAHQVLTILRGELCDWLVVDNYKLGKQWELIAHKVCRHLLVIDDLADRCHEADLLVDQNYYTNYQSRYDHLLPPTCERLLGLKYLLLSDSYYQSIRKPKVYSSNIKNILVFFGGSDPTKETEKFLTAIKYSQIRNTTYELVVGAANPRAKEIELLCKNAPSVRFHFQTNQMDKLCERADLALGTGGSANWERFCFGVPTLVIATAKNQVETVNSLYEAGAIKFLGWHSEISPIDVLTAILDAVNNPSEMFDIAQCARQLITEATNYGAKFVAERMQAINRGNNGF